ncbi:metalloprotease TldD [Pseudomonas bohemica]|uniref:metalloprotease TldD n=1 Tax=Pseudomonas bohemica TaxID=2044872 RepID=UPI000DA60336|nr:metalloprotease TldD [Pseudomonas bohemica]
MTDIRLTIACERLLAPYGVDLNDLRNTLDQVMEHQVDFADLYLQSRRRESWSLENSQVTGGTFSVDHGFGLRASELDQSAFAYSQQITREQLQKAALSVRSIAGKGRNARVAIPEPRALMHSSYGTDDPLPVLASAAKVALLERIEQLACALDPRVSRAGATLELTHEVMMVMRHDGRLAADVRPLLMLHMWVVVEHNGRRETASGGMGGRNGFEHIEMSLVEAEVRRVVDSALTNLDAIQAPSGQLPVVLASGWPGMLLHEAMGHGFEGDFNRVGSSVYASQMDKTVAAPGVTIVDDATVPGARGSLNIDDEGEPGQRTTLIENGVLRSYMHDDLNARLMGQKVTGNGRRQSYAHLPMPRMTNTFMQPGPYAAEEIIASVKHGVYLADLGSGQVDIVSGQFSFQSALAWLIEDGRLTTPIRGATLTGSGPQTLRQISMVGNDLALDRGLAICGKAGQSVPVGVGQPTLKIDGLVVGGTA